MSIRPAQAARIGIAACAALAVGCTLLPPADPPPAIALLDKMPDDIPRANCRAPLVRVERPEARPAYDTTRMAYTQQSHQIAYFSRNEWAERPSQMLHPMLVRALEATGCIRALVPPDAGPAAYVLRTEVVELTQDFTQEPPQARLALRVRWLDAGTGHLVAARDVVQREVMRQKNPAAGVQAANEAAAKAMREVARFALEMAGPH
jgi:cholesterol transport system auxiliary component